jgi:L-asparagine oxygenase
LKSSAATEMYMEVLCNSMSHSIKEDVTRHGYAFVREYCPGTDTVTIASALGRPLTPWKDGLIQELVPLATATPNTYSGIYGLGRFPFHTDLAHWCRPPRYLLLRCVIGYADVPTLLIDGQAIFDTVTLDILTRAIFKPRRPRNGTLALLRLCEPTDGGYCFRWDEAFLNPASRIGAVASQLVRERLNTCEPLSIALVRAGDTLLIDNWRMLHARSLIPAEREDRRIQRIYLEELH